MGAATGDSPAATTGSVTTTAEGRRPAAVASAAAAMVGAQAAAAARHDPASAWAVAEVEVWGSGSRGSVATATNDVNTERTTPTLKKWWNYIKAWFTKKSNEVMDPIEIEQAIQDAQRKDQQLRNQAAQVIAHRTQVAGDPEDAAGDVAEAKELAKQALLKADASMKAGNAADAEKWNAARARWP